jgi:hypothetical protein
MAIRIEDNFMALDVDGAVVATARFGRYAAGDDLGAWIVSTHPRRLLNRNEAINALTLAERLAAGYGDDDPCVIGWREELFLWRTDLSGSRPRSPW